MNKNYFTFILGLFIANTTFAQIDSLARLKSQSNKTEYIFNSKNCKINLLGVFFAPEIGASTLDSKMSPLSGGSFMFLVNKKVGFGVSGQITGSADNNKQLLKLGYGGVKLEYTIKPNAKFHATIPLLIGAGFANNDSTDHFRNANNFYNNNGFNGGNRGRNGGFDQHHSNGAQFFVIQPGINIEGNLLKFMKIFAGVNYRFATKMNNEKDNNNTLPAIKASQISGISINVGLKIGVFDYQLHKRDSLRRKHSENYRRFR
jgi:hypothetical protein